MANNRDKHWKQAGSSVFKSTKHQRSRKGCITCRHRRVKCDESHPTCGRCASAQRDCAYLPSRGFPRQFTSYALAQGYSDQLPSDVRLYLNFHDQFITTQHYFLKPCASSEIFIRRTLPAIALKHNALLYAILSLSSYFHSLQSPKTTLNTFLNYYITSLTLLRECVGSKDQNREATLLTILVLTTIEEYCGDLVNLLNHYQAAKVLILDLLTPESIDSNEVHLNMFLWYSRSDVLSSLLSMREPSLPVHWYRAKEKSDILQAEKSPRDPNKSLTLVASMIRRAGAEMALVYARLSKGKLTLIEFSRLNEDLHGIFGRAKEILQDLGYELTASMNTAAVRDIKHTWLDYLAWEMMLKYQTMVILKKPLSSELHELAQRQRDLIEELDKSPGDQKAYFCPYKISLMMASFFLSHEVETQMWTRRKLARIERAGYVFAPRFRAALATLWQAPEVHRWWLPGDEGVSNTVREIRLMVSERYSWPLDDYRRDFCNLKSLFWEFSGPLLGPTE